MRGLDYRWLAALDEVLNQRSFDKAAAVLCISQSAVSQRIKQLEKWLAQPVLVREQPPRATPAGQKLLGLYRRVQLLEQDLLPELGSDELSQALPVSVATNADSLATWLIPALQPLIASGQFVLNLEVEDEGRTLDKLRSGEVVAAISRESAPLPGCQADYLGIMEYLCVATPQFCQRYFPHGVTPQALRAAPAVVFDQHDHMHEHFIRLHFDLSISEVSKHTVRSSEAFVKMALAGAAYCLIPRLQIEKELQEGFLCVVTPEYSITQRLYWHHWQLESGLLQQLSTRIVAYAQQHLQQ
jgi:LysR family transcriptional regulator (chromosome initiation inhibitor)